MSLFVCVIIDMFMLCFDMLYIFADSLCYGSYVCVMLLISICCVCVMLYISATIYLLIDDGCFYSFYEIKK